jgi:hypothetical protein
MDKKIAKSLVFNTETVKITDHTLLCEQLYDGEHAIINAYKSSKKEVLKTRTKMPKTTNNRQ